MQIVHKTITDSTMIDVRHAFENGEEPGYCVVADMQRAGRGSRGRSWTSKPNGGLYATVLLSIADEVAHLATLACANVIVSYFDIPELRIKWPNDIFFHEKKCGGILAEKCEKDRVILGFGLNLKDGDHLRAFDAVSLEALQPPTPTALLESLLPNLLKTTSSLCAENAMELISEVDGRLIWKNHEVTCDETHGIFRGLSKRGAALIECNGKLKEVWAGTMRRIAD